MTALSGPILFNNSTGSDTAASGCGPATAVTTSAMFSSGSNGVTVSSSTGMSVGDLIYVPANTGRKFNVIASISGTSITCDDNWDDSQNGVSIYVGGKRATLDNADSRAIFTDAPSQSTGSGAGWKLNLENTGTNYTISSNIALSNQIIIEGLGTSKVVIEQTSNTSHFTASSRKYYHRFKNIQFINSNATKTSPAFNCNDNGPNLILVDCVVGSDVSADRVYRGIAKGGLTSSNLFAYRTVFKNAVNSNIRIYNGNLSAYLDSCQIVDAGVTGFYRSHNAGSLFLNKCIVANNTSYGVYYATSAYGNDCYNTIFYNNGNDSFQATSLSTSARISGCIFAENSGYGFSAVNTSSHDSPMVQNNAFYSNTSGATNNVTFDSTNVSLQADPFVDAANGDFNLNADAGGGATLRATNYTLGG
jgi:hypothetical protein